MVTTFSVDRVRMRIGPFFLHRSANCIQGLVFGYCKEVEHCWLVDIWEDRDSSFELFERCLDLVLYLIQVCGAIKQNER